MLVSVRKEIVENDGLECCRYDALKAFYDKHQHQRKVEVWDPVSTQLNFHESKMTMVSLDNDHQEKMRIANGTF